MFHYDANEFMSHLYEGVYIVDKNRKIVFWNSGSEHITGYQSDEVVKSHCYHNILNHVDKDGKHLCFNGCPLHHTLKTGEINENDVFLQHKLGHRIPVSVKTMPLYNDDQEIVAAVEVFTDLRYKEQQYHEHEALKKMVHIDALTELYNRRYLEFRLAQAKNEFDEFNDSFGLLFIDIDHFKNINDSYGHDIGDGVLKVIAQTLKSNIRPEDIVGRWGGEEFIAIIKTNDLDTLTMVAERLRKLLENSLYRKDKHEIKVTVSIGGSIYHKDDSIGSLIKRSDQHMYKAKSLGRNQVFIK